MVQALSSQKIMPNVHCPTRTLCVKKGTFEAVTPGVFSAETVNCVEQGLILIKFESNSLEFKVLSFTSHSDKRNIQEPIPTFPISPPQLDKLKSCIYINVWALMKYLLHPIQTSQKKVLTKTQFPTSTFWSGLSEPSKM